jgi:hypothetical protein
MRQELVGLRSSKLEVPVLFRTTTKFPFPGSTPERHLHLLSYDTMTDSHPRQGNLHLQDTMGPLPIHVGNQSRGQDGEKGILFLLFIHLTSTWALPLGFSGVPAATCCITRTDHIEKKALVNYPLALPWSRGLYRRRGVSIRGRVWRSNRWKL